MIAYDTTHGATGPQIGPLYSKLIVAIFLLTTAAIIWLPQPENQDGFRGRTPSSSSFTE